jgi:hypothetical protein
LFGCIPTIETPVYLLSSGLRPEIQSARHAGIVDLNDPFFTPNPLPP